MSLQVFRDGRPDRRIEDNALLKKLQREDDYHNALDQHLKRNWKEGTYGYMGMVADPTKGVTVPKSAFGAGMSRAERIQRVRDRMARNEPPQSLFYDTSTDTELLYEEDAEAYEEGWICPECLQYQGVVTNECNWRFTGERPDNPKHQGCGYRRDIF